MAVPIHDARLPAANRGPLDPLIAVLQTYPRVLLVIVVLLAVLLICAIVMIALISQTRNECDREDNGGGGSNPVSSSCGWGGKDLSVLNYDLSYSFNTVTWYMRPCGSVTNSVCSGRFNGVSQACTYQTSNGIVWDNGDWYGNSAIDGAWSAYGAGGLQYHTSNGGSCGSGTRSLYIFYACESGSNGYISQVVESACVTHYFVNTQFVC